MFSIPRPFFSTVSITSEITRNVDWRAEHQQPQICRRYWSLELENSRLMRVSDNISHYNLIIYNFKLANKYNAPNNRIHIINIEYSSGKDELLDVDDLSTKKCALTMKEAINKSTSVLSSPKFVSSVAKEECFNMTQLVEIDKKDIGNVIGKAGRTISKLTSDFQVSMSVRKWLEPSEDDLDSFVENTGSADWRQK